MHRGILAGDFVALECKIVIWLSLIFISFMHWLRSVTLAHSIFRPSIPSVNNILSRLPEKADLIETNYPIQAVHNIRPPTYTVSSSTLIRLHDGRSDEGDLSAR
jgi:hypothetical protein